MRPVVWRFVEWRIRRHLPASQHNCVLGDLEEDWLKQRDAIGAARADLWLLRECASLAAAYPTRVTRTRSAMSVLRMEDVTRAIRRLAARPGASLASIVTLACGLAATAATWTIVSAVLVSPLPVASPDTLETIGIQSVGEEGSPLPVFNEHQYSFYPAVRDSGVFAHVVAVGRYSLRVQEAEGDVNRNVFFATHNFFDVLGITLAAGTGFRAEDDRQGAAPVAILSDRYWRAHLNADPNVIGKSITVGGASTTVVGVAPPKFRGLSLVEAPDFYMPMQTLRALVHPMMNYFMDGTSQSSPTAWLTILGRLNSGETPQSAADRLTAHLRSLTPPLMREPASVVLTGVNITALPEASRAGMQKFTRLLAITVGLLLLIGSLTVGMLLLIRTEARRDEFAMCLALGATRTRLAAGVVIEGVLLSLAAAAISVPITAGLFAGISAYELPGEVAISLLELSSGATTLMAAAGAAVVSSVLIGLVAGAFGVSGRVGDVLRARAGGTPRVTRRRLRMGLVATQVAVTLVLLVGTGLFARSLIAALNLNGGIDPARLIEGSVNLRDDAYTTPRADEFFGELQRRLGQEPSIRSVAMSRWLGGMGRGGKLTIDGAPLRMPSTVPFTDIDEHYFETVGLKVVRGRNFSSADVMSAPLVGIVSESLGRVIAQGGDPIGRTIAETFNRPGQPPAVIRIVGVVPDVVTSVRTMEPLVLYYPIAQRPSSNSRTLTIRAHDVSAATAATMSAIRALDPQLKPAPLLTKQEKISLQMGPQQLGVTVLGALGVIALILTVLGTYVLAETMAVVRQREMGIRAALGATRRQLGDLVLRETAMLVGTGVMAGLGLAWLGAGTIRAFLFHVEPLDVPTLIAVTGTILLLALAVSLRPAVRAGRVELSTLLRED